MKHLAALFLTLFLFLSLGLHGAVQQAPAQVGDAPSPVALRLDGADLYPVIDLIMGQTLNLNYIVDPAVKGTVTISTGATLQRSDLLPILEAVLKINGATMNKSGNFYQIVPAAAAMRQSLAVQSRLSASPDDQMVIHVVRMRFVAAVEMERLLRPFLGEGGTISIHDTGNVLLVADRQSNLRKLLDIIDIFDSDSFEGERVRMVPIKNASAKDLVDDLRDIFSAYAMSDKEAAVRFLPMERIRSVLVVTPNPDVFPVVEKWIAQLDQETLTGGVRTFIYKAKHSRAADLQKVLSQVYSNNALLYTDSRLQQPVTPAGAQNPQVPTAGNPIGAPLPPAQSGSSAQAASSAFDSSVRIIADELNNKLLVQATQQVFADIERTLRELDVQRRQVLIDAQIYEVTLDDSSSLGISAMLQNRGVAEQRGTVGAFATSQGGSSPSLSVQTFTYVGRTRELLLFLNAQENRTRIRTLSAPSVLVTDNMAAEFQVGAEVPIPVSSSLTPVQSEGTNLFANTIQFRNTGVILNVKPQINDGGGVSLEIQQEVSQAGANTTSGIVAPLIGKSAVKSTIVAENGQTIALGGFIRESDDLSKNRVPIVGRVPVFGALFGNTTRSKTRTELFILITPHVIENRGQADLATEELRGRLIEIQKVMK